MNFDRKSGNSNGKVAEDSNTFRELPRMFGSKVQSGFSGRAMPADRQNFAGGVYPSGAFPALDIAYPDQAAAEAGGNFVPDHSATGSQAAFSPYDEPAAAARGGEPPAPYTMAPPSGAPYRNPAPAGGGAASAFSPDEDYEVYAPDPAFYASADKAPPYDFCLQEPQMQGFAAQESYAYHSFTPENAPGGYEPEGYEEAYAAEEAPYAAMPGAYAGGGAYAPDSRPEEPGTSAGSFAGDNGRGAAAGEAAEPFYAEASFQHGLNGDPALQPVEFESSDYDYNYNPQAEESFEPECAAGAGRPPYPADTMPADPVYEPGAYPAPEAAGRPQDYDTAAFGDIENSGVVEQAPVRQDFTHGYNMQAVAYNGSSGGFYAHETGRHNNSRAFVAAANLYADPAGHNEETAGDFAKAGFDYADAAGDLPYNMADEAPLPFIEDEEENTDLAADFARLKADAGVIDTAAGRSPSGSSGDNFARPPMRPEGAIMADTELFAAPPRRAAAAVSPGGAAQAMPYAGEQGFAPEAAYGDSLYDWAAPVAAPAPPHKQAYPAVKKAKGKKMLLLAAVSLFLLLLAAGLYWFLSNRPVSYNGEPVIIHKAAGDYKVRPDNPVTKAVDNQEQSVREGVSDDNAGGNRQKNLIDKTETPVEMQKIEDRLPFSGEGSFDQSSVDSLIKSAVARAAPVHIIPAVRVNSDRKLVTSAARRGEGEILIPGAGGAAAAKQEGKPEKTGSKVSLAPPAAAGSSAAPPIKTARQAAAPIAKSPAGKTELAQAAAIGGSFYMQISSQPSKEAAEQSVARARKYLGEDVGRRIVIVPALIPNKGTYYRVRIPAESHEAAARLCEDYKQAGGTCFVAR